MEPIVIVGGGIAGLAAAWELERAGRAFLLLEASGRLGGVIASGQEDGFVIEYGPDSFLTQKPAAAKLCEELGLGGELIGSEAGGRTTILHHGRLTALPAGWQMLAPGEIWPAVRTPLLSLGTKAALLRRWLGGAAAAGAEGESVGEFLRRHLGARAGQELIDTVAGPLLAGVYGGDVERLEIAAVLPRLAEMGRGGNLLRALQRQGRQAKAPAGGGTPLFTTLRGGLGSMIAALRARLPETAVRLGTAVAEIAPAGGGGYRVRLAAGGEIGAREVIVATPAWAAAEMLGGVDAELAAALGAVPYASSLVVNLAYEVAPQLPPGFGFLVPRGEGQQLFACTFVHRKFAERTPAGAGLLRLFYTGEPLTWTEDKVAATARAEVGAILGVRAEPRFIRCGWSLRAMAQYTRGHGARVATITAALARHPGLRLAGNAYRGIGIPDCIAAGRGAAAAVVEQAAR